MAKRWVMTPARRAYYNSKKRSTKKAKPRTQAGSEFKRFYREMRAAGESKYNSRWGGYTAMSSADPTRYKRVVSAYTKHKRRLDSKKFAAWHKASGGDFRGITLP